MLNSVIILIDEHAIIIIIGAICRRVYIQAANCTNFKTNHDFASHDIYADGVAHNLCMQLAHTTDCSINHSVSISISDVESDVELDNFINGTA